MKPLVLQHTNISSLAGEISRTEPYVYAEDEGLSEIIKQLPFVATIAYWIATRRKDMMEKSNIKILVIGVQFLDVVDEGQWYSLIPLLLGREGTMDIHVDMVGPEYHLESLRDPKHYQSLDPERTDRICRNITLHNGTVKTPATIYPVKLNEYMAENNADDNDLIFCFNPCMTNHYDDWMDDSFAQILNSNQSIVFTGGGVEDYTRDKLALQAHGFNDLGEMYSNLFALELTSRSLNGVIYELAGNAPSPVDMQEPHCIEVMFAINTLIAEYAPYDSNTFLREMLLTATDSNEKNFYRTLPYGLFIDKKSRAINYLNGEDYPCDTGTVMDEDNYKAMPDDNGSHEHKLRWCGEMILKYDLKGIADKYYGLSGSQGQTSPELNLDVSTHVHAQGQTHGRSQYSS